MKGANKQESKRTVSSYMKQARKLCSRVELKSSEFTASRIGKTDREVTRLLDYPPVHVDMS